MDKNNEQKNNKTPEMKPKQDSFRPWLKLIPAAAVFAAVCVTCYQADKSPVETTSVSDNNVISTDEIKELMFHWFQKSLLNQNPYLQFLVKSIL